jgi:hypothetical protein
MEKCVQRFAKTPDTEMEQVTEPLKKSTGQDHSIPGEKEQHGHLEGNLAHFIGMGERHP